MGNKGNVSDLPICSMCGKPIKPEDRNTGELYKDVVAHQRCIDAQMMYANAWG